MAAERATTIISRGDEKVAKNNKNRGNNCVKTKTGVGVEKEDQMGLCVGIKHRWMDGGIAEGMLFFSV